MKVERLVVFSSLPFTRETLFLASMKEIIGNGAPAYVRCSPNKPQEAHFAHFHEKIHLKF